MNPQPRLRPLTLRSQSYELLDLAAKPLGRYLTLQQVLDAIAEWPPRTVFLVRLWSLGGGTLRVEIQWLMNLGLDGRYRSARTRKHWTIRPGPC